MNINNLVLECLKNGLTAQLSYNREKDRLEYQIPIGSKSGTGNIYEEDGKIILETRYNQKDEIETFDDVVDVAYQWFFQYMDRAPFTSPEIQWVQHFLNRGWINEEMTPTYIAVRRV